MILTSFVIDAANLFGTPMIHVFRAIVGIRARLVFSFPEVGNDRRAKAP